MWLYYFVDAEGHSGDGFACEGGDDRATTIRNDAEGLACWRGTGMSKRTSMASRMLRPVAGKRHGIIARWRDDSGVAAVEFAVIAPIAVALFAGIVQFGFVLFIESHMASVAKDAARRFTVGATDETETATYAQAALLNWGVTYTVTVTPPDPSDPADVDVDVSISLPRSSVAIIDMLGLFQSGSLTASVTMLAE